MEQPKEIISLQRYYLENFIIVYHELVSKIDSGASMTKEELSSFIEELRDYALRGGLGTEYVDKVIEVQGVYCN